MIEQPLGKMVSRKAKSTCPTEFGGLGREDEMGRFPGRARGSREDAGPSCQIRQTGEPVG